MFCWLDHYILHCDEISQFSITSLHSVGSIFMYLYIIDGHKTKDRNPFLGDETSYISDGDPFGSTCSKKAGKLVEKMIHRKYSVFSIFV